jgi:phenylacetate-CoA ligase
VSIHGIAWPRLPDLTPAAVHALQAELDRSERMSADELAHHQRRQLAEVLAHAAASVPHYRGRFDPRDLATVPILTRAALVAAGDGLLSQAYPASHGLPHEVATSRTTGAPVRVRGTDVIGALWQAITVRDHRWHRRDLHASLAAIRHTRAGAAAPPDGLRTRGWGAATAALAPDAPMALLSLASTTAEQVAWLRRVAPAYVMTYPSALHAILDQLATAGLTLPTVREVRTVGERLAPATRGLCRDVLDVPIVDTYSAQEVGYVALQCPEHEHYHVQAERLVVEILRDDGTPCARGETGRVVITDLHNFATPLLRYEIGDHAEVGGPCPCGRGLPVLTRIVGRARNMLVYPDGRTVWPVFTIACREASPYHEIQLVQPRVDLLRLRVVPDGARGPVDGAALAAALRRVFDHAFEVEIELVEAIARTPAGKLEEFVSLVSPPR